MSSLCHNKATSIKQTGFYIMLKIVNPQLRFYFCMYQSKEVCVTPTSVLAVYK